MYSVVIPTYKRPKELQNCLRFIFNQTIKPKEVVVSGVIGDKTIEEVIPKLSKECESRGISFKFIGSYRKGISYQRNRGMEAAQQKYILMIDDDVEIPPNFVETAISILNEKKALIVSGFDTRPPIVRKFQNLWRRVFYLDYYAKNFQIVLPSGSKVIAYTADREISTQWLSTTVWVMRSEVAKKIKFDENLVNYSHREDQDYSYTVYKVFGGGLILSPRLKFVHHHSSAGRIRVSKFCHLYVYNTFLLFRKHFFNSPRSKAIFIWSMIGMAIQGLNHALQQRNLGIFYETIVALARVVVNWSNAKHLCFKRLYEPVSDQNI
ncbi:MAG: glycosyltransferase [candidate division WOR-3 bacterium]